MKLKNEIKMKINNEKELLNLFVDEDALMPQMQEPFINSNYEGEVWATDGQSLLIVNRKCLSGEYPTIKLTLPKLRNENCDRIILYKDLLWALNECPQVDEEIEIGKKDEECEECNGTGVVEWEYTDRNNRDWERYFDCPCCNGSGYSNKPITKKTGNKVPDETASVQVDTMVVSVAQMSRLLKVMDILGIDRVRHAITSNEEANLFILDDDIKVLIMPYLREDIAAVVKTTKGGNK